MGKYCLILFVDDVESGFKGAPLIHQPHLLLSHVDNLGISSNLPFSPRTASSCICSMNSVRWNLAAFVRAARNFF